MWRTFVRLATCWPASAVIAVVMAFAAVVSAVGRDGRAAVLFATLFGILALGNAAQAWSAYRRPRPRD